jgi:pyruvate,orthophosphate dikinase
MFFAPDRIDLVRAMVLAETSEIRREVLQKMLPMQQQDFLEIFRLARNQQVTVRLLDPPLHEFLPDPRSENFDAQLKDMAKRLGQSGVLGN